MLRGTAQPSAPQPTWEAGASEQPPKPRNRILEKLRCRPSADDSEGLAVPATIAQPAHSVAFVRFFLDGPGLKRLRLRQMMTSPNRTCPGRPESFRQPPWSHEGTGNGLVSESTASSTPWTTRCWPSNSPAIVASHVCADPKPLRAQEARPIAYVEGQRVPLTNAQEKPKALLLILYAAAKRRSLD